MIFEIVIIFGITIFVKMFFGNIEKEEGIYWDIGRWCHDHDYLLSYLAPVLLVYVLILGIREWLWG